MEKPDKENLVALSDDELDNVTGGFGFVTLEQFTPGRRMSAAVENMDRKKNKRARFTTLEKKSGDKSGAQIEFL